MTITPGDNLFGDTISHVLTSSIMRVHVNMATGSWRERLQQFQVDLRVMNAHKGKGD
jgi:hypothetical protein